MSLILGLEHPCSWLRKGLSSVGLSLVSDFFLSLALTSSLVSSTSPLSNVINFNNFYSQRWSRGHKARGQVHQKKSETKAKAKDSLYEDRHSQDQGQECSRPRPMTKEHKRKCSPKKKGLHKNFFRRSQKKKKPSQKFFRRSPQNNVFQKIFQALHKILTNQK